MERLIENGGESGNNLKEILLDFGAAITKAMLNEEEGTIINSITGEVIGTKKELEGLIMKEDGDDSLNPGYGTYIH